MTDAKRGGRYPKGEARRQEILDRALEVFAERGSAGMSMRAIALEIGVTHSAIQHYFGSIEEILLEVIELRDARNRSAGNATPNELLRDQLQRGAAANTNTRGLTALYTSLLGASIEPGNELSRNHFTARFAAGREELRQVIEEGRADGTVPEGPDAELLAAVVMAAFDGLQIQWLLDPTIDISSTLSALAPLLGDARATPQHVTEMHVSGGASSTA